MYTNLYSRVRTFLWNFTHFVPAYANLRQVTLQEDYKINYIDRHCPLKALYVYIQIKCKNRECGK